MVFCDNFFHGLSRENFTSLERASSKRKKYSFTCPLDQGAIAPSLMDRLSSGTTNSASTSNFVPIPEHSGQAPNGELKENERGSNSSNDRLQS